MRSLPLYGFSCALPLQGRLKPITQIMCKTDLCEQIIALVSKETEIAVSDIMSHDKRPDVVDARYLAVYLMLEKGVPAYRVASLMNMSERNVYHVKERFEDRKDYGDPMLRQYYTSIRKALKQV